MKRGKVPEYCPGGPGLAVRGRVLVPDTVDDATRDGGLGLQRRESPGRGKNVRIFRRGRPETPLASGKTDAKGRWCLRVAADTDFGVELVAATRWSDAQLRRSVISQWGQTLSFRSEALARELSSTGTDVSDSRYANLQTVASTALDLRTPVYRRPGESPGDFLERATRRLRESERFRAMLTRGVDMDAE